MTANEDQKWSMDGVSDYRTAAPDIREAMDRINDEIDPYDVNTILTAGKEPLDRLADVADQVMRRSGADNAIMASMEDLQEEISSVNFGELAGTAARVGAKSVGWMVKNPGAMMAGAASAMLLGPMALVGVPFAKSQLDKFSTKRHGESQTDKLRKMISKSGDILDKLQQAGNDIPQEITAIDELGRARLVAYQDVSLHIGAYTERLRRLDEEEIPTLRDSLAGKTDFDAEINLQTLEMSSERLAERINAMLASRLVSQASMVTLMRLKGIFAQAAGKIQNHLAFSGPQWKTQIAESGVLLAASKITDAIKEADDFGMAVVTQGAKVADETARMMAKSLKDGTYDTQKLIGVLKDITTSLGNDVKLIGSRKADLEKDRIRLAEASAVFRGNVARIAQQADGRMALPSAMKPVLTIQQDSGPKGMG